MRTVDVLHPAAMRLTPHRARTERIVFSAERVHVTLREADPVAFEPTGWAARAGSVPILSHDGGFWSRLDHVEEGRGRVRPAELVAALSGRGGLPGVLEAAFKGTPLMAWGNLGNAGYLHPKVVGHRGDDVDLTQVRAVSRDGRPAAADAVRRHLDADWRIVGDAVYRRASILARRVVNHSPGLLDVAHDPSFRLTGGFNAVASPTTYPALLALWQPSGIGEPDPRIEGWLAAGFGDAFHGDEHRVAANSYPASLRREVEYEMNVRAGIYGWEDDLVKALRVHRDAMLDLEVEGMTGVCGMDDPGPPLLAMQRALRLLVDAGCRGASVVGEFGMAQRVSRFYIPTLPDLRIEPEDDAALGAVVP